MENYNFSVELGKIVEEFDLEKIWVSKDYEKTRIVTNEVNRPSLQIAGFFDYFYNNFGLPRFWPPRSTSASSLQKSSLLSLSGDLISSLVADAPWPISLRVSTFRNLLNSEGPHTR